MERLNQWLIDRGPVRRNTVHYGEGDILFRVIQSDGGYHIVGALVEEKWVRRHAELDERLERPTHPERYRKAGRLLVRVYLDRYRFDNGRKGRAIFIERLQIVPGPLRLEYTRELEIRRELLEAIGEWGRSNGIAVYMMRPEVIREVRRGLKEKTIKFNYYRPVEPAVWGTETLIVKNSAFVMPEKPYRWFIYLGREPVAVSPAAGAEEDQFKDRLSPPAGGLEELPEPAAQAEEATRAGAEEAAVATEL